MEIRIVRTEERKRSVTQHGVKGEEDGGSGQAAARESRGFWRDSGAAVVEAALAAGVNKNEGLAVAVTALVIVLMVVLVDMPFT